MDPKIASGTLRPGLCLPGQVYRALKSIEAEDDAAGRHRAEDRRQVARVHAAVRADLEIRSMKAGEHQGDGGGSRNEQFEERDGAVGSAKTFTLQKLSRK
jgi:hypothetical protein